MESHVRVATDADLPALRDIEDAAGRAFTEIGMALVGADPPPSIQTLRQFQSDGRAWVWTDADDHPVGYLIAAVVDGTAHVEQVSVHPDYAHRRIGRALIEQVIGWVRGRYLPAVTLTTYTQVAWNGPYYQRCGFRYLAEEELTVGLRAIRAAEIADGLDRWPRACLRKDL